MLTVILQNKFGKYLVNAIQTDEYKGKDDMLMFPKEGHIFSNTFTHLKWHTREWETTFKKLELFNLHQNEATTIHSSSADLPLIKDHLLCILPFLFLTFFFYKHIANLNAHLTELKESQLKQMILNIRLKNQVKSSENFIEIYRDALLRYKERAETAEALVKRYNNATCKNDSLEKRISQMEEIQFKTIIQELTNDFD